MLQRSNYRARRLSAALLMAGVIATSACAPDATPAVTAPLGVTPVDKSARTHVGVAAGSNLVGIASTGSSAMLAQGNQFYNVFVSEQPGARGQYTVGTGRDHPITIARGGPQNILYGGHNGSIGSSFTTLRSYSSRTDYVQTINLPRSGFTVHPLDYNGATIEPLGTTGFKTTYVLTAPDRFTVEQIIRVNGTTFQNSSVELAMTVTNNGSFPVSIGIRNLWDFMIGADDGPLFYTRHPDAGPQEKVETFVNPTFAFYKLEDNTMNPVSPIYAVYGTNTGPSQLTPAPSGATMIQHANWYTASFTAFDFSTVIEWVSNLDNDGAVLTYIGETGPKAKLLQPGEKFTFTHSMYASPSDGTPPPFEVVTPTNRQPVANAGADVGRECVANALVTLDGSGSSDPDGDALTYEWTSGGTLLGTSPTLQIPLDLGTHTLTLRVSDTHGASATDEVQVRVTDTQSPTIALSLTPGTIWPANHKYVRVDVAASATDACDGASLLIIDGLLTSDEPDDDASRKDGITTGDIRVETPEGVVRLSSNASPSVYWTPGSVVDLRSEKEKGGAGRNYTLVVNVRDRSGNLASRTALVKVAPGGGKP